MNTDNKQYVETYQYRCPQCGYMIEEEKEFAVPYCSRCGCKLKIIAYTKQLKED